jgi:acyl-CoA synthetase (AMP-forming)/AMP-acid ligase II
VVLASHPDFESYDLSSLRFFLCGAAPLGEGLVTRLLERFNKKSERSGKGNSGLIIAQGYGCVFSGSYEEPLVRVFSADSPFSCTLRHRVCRLYSLTETSPTALVLMPNVALEPGKIGSTGTLAPHLQARLVDDNGNDALPNEEDGGPRGELWLRASGFTYCQCYTLCGC